MNAPAALGGRLRHQRSVRHDHPIRLMIVDDSAIARSVLSRMLSFYDDFEVVALAGSASEALDALRSVRVDIVLLDVEMPGGSGLEALPEILRQGGGARVMMLSSICEDGADATEQALALGAADTLPKPGTGNFAGRFSQTLADRIRRIGHSKAERSFAPADQPPPTTVYLRAMPEWKLGCLAIGASTGGLHAINEFLRALPAGIDAPILITQHLPALFVPFFARQLQGAAGKAAVVAEEGRLLANDEICIAPGDSHLTLERSGARVRVRLSKAPAASGCLPSIDPMLGAVAECYGKSGVGVMLSGMGRDGVEGSRRLVDSGGAMLAQDHSSSAVWGMPRAVAEAGLACAVLPPAALARRIAARIEGAAWK